MSQTSAARHGARKRVLRALSSGHVSDHRPLVTALGELRPSPGDGRLDLVAVPAARLAENLTHAAEVAARAGAQILVMCSRMTCAEEAYKIVTGIIDPSQVTVLEIRPGWSIPRLPLEADRSSLFDGRQSDTHVKRNVAIAVCRAIGLKRLLFLDDDVRGFDATHQANLEYTLTDHRDAPVAIGWAFDEFPDNSVVCHAYREVGGRQGTFIGAGALGLRVDAETPHFPRMYNEDWLFLLPLMLRGRSRVVFGGTLAQEPYDPYEFPKNAVQQEAGDLIAESLFRCLHDRRSLEGCLDQGFWRDALRQRRAFVTEIRTALARSDKPVAGRARVSLEHVLDMSHRSSAWPTLIANWLAAWQRDQRRWAQWLADVQPAPTVAAAVRGFGLEPVVTMPDRSIVVAAGTA